jgi:hypothetical protein
MSKIKQELAVRDEALLAELDQAYPKEVGGFTRISLPRIAFASQDVTEGKGKAMTVVTEAGTFFTERQGDELNEEGKKKWNKEEVGSAMQAVILYRRYQLSYYDEATEEYTSSPVFDSMDEVVPLFKAKQQIAKGTPAQLKDLYKFVDKDGKTKSRLKDNRILYVLKDGELFQMNLHGSSMYSFLKYERTVNPPTVLTAFASEPQEKGSIAWNMITFKPVRPLDNTELAEVVGKVREIKEAIGLEKGAQGNTPIKAEIISNMSEEDIDFPEDK